MGESGKGGLYPVYSDDGRARVRPRPSGMQRSKKTQKLPDLRTACGWLLGSIEPPPAVAAALAKLDQKASEMLPVPQVEARLRDGVVVGKLIFGLDKKESHLRLRHAIARAWWLSWHYADSLQNHWEHIQKVKNSAPYHLHLLRQIGSSLDQVRKTLEHTRGLVDELKQDLPGESASVARWQFNPEPGLVEGYARLCLSSLEEIVDRNLAWANGQAPSHGNEGDDEDEDGDLVRGLSPDILGLMVDSYWRGFEEATVGTESRMETAHTAREALQYELGQRRQPTEIVLPLNSGREATLEVRLEKVLAAIEEYEGPGRKYWFQTTNGVRLDLLWWVRLAEVYSVTFGQVAPFHATVSGTRAANLNNGPNQRVLDFIDFARTVMGCVGWPDAGAFSLDSAFRAVRENFGTSLYDQVRSNLDQLADPSEPICVGGLPSAGMLADERLTDDGFRDVYMRLEEILAASVH